MNHYVVAVNLIGIPAHDEPMMMFFHMDAPNWDEAFAYLQEQLQYEGVYEVKEIRENGKEIRPDAD